MLITIEVRGDQRRPATDVGFLLHKHPERVQRFSTSQGTATVMFPAATRDVCRMACHVDGAGARWDRSGTMGRYVNVIPYAASSRLIVALGKVFGDAVAGRCDHRPDLVEHRWPMTVSIPSVPIGGRCTVQDVLEPLGWDVRTSAQPLDPADWRDSEFVTVRLTGEHTMRDALRHLSVCLPVVAGDKHYFVDDSEVAKLDRLGQGWLAAHPCRDRIVAAYVKGIGSLADEALTRLSGDIDGPAGDGTPDRGATATTPAYRPSLARQRRITVAEEIIRSGARSVLDAGCGEGRLLGELAAELPSTVLAGVDVSAAAIGQARRRLDRWRGIALWQSSLMYVDPRCRGYDLVVLMEVIEHIDLDRLPPAMASVFGAMAPRTVVVTTPNHDHNVEYGLAGRWRHPDHRFEFTRAEFGAWCASIADEYAYRCTMGAIGEPAEATGAPTQYAVFTREDGAPS